MKIKKKTRSKFTSIVLDAALMFEIGGNWRNRLKCHNLIGSHGKKLDKLAKANRRPDGQNVQGHS